ncbi:S1C family serine protease [Paeniglutamicibacter kerguelensis]|uniref:Serine protease PepD n=1 Tax=Paeniglutamicibacter kerguelensis TaxID=254788 RepID=A0ABS4XE00_9MICC|nr:trypsin-like peptidase domain-containing protein [Paeniglutamicibacter kerguelensis]MBP2386706.1 putative serine protease PepD [Paeniglutamicibacter kerguelensis]
MSENQFEQPNSPENPEQASTPVPQRPMTPPAAPEQDPAVSKVDGAVEQTQALPRHTADAAPATPSLATPSAAAPAAGTAPAPAHAAVPGAQSPAHAPYGTPTHAEQASAFGVPSPVPPANRAAPKKFTAGVLVLGMVAAALVGAGSAVGANALMYPASSSASAGNNAPQSGLVINNPKNVTAVTAAAAKASPSVVTIDVSGSSSSGSGSGIILDAEGHILTNTHVVTLGGTTASPKIAVQMSDGKVYNATLVGTDPLSDLAVIKIEAQGLTPATLGTSGNLNVGDTAVAIGAPLGLSGTVTDGIISTLNRTISVASSAVPEQSEGTEPNNNGNQFNFQLPGAPQQQAPASQGSIYINVIQTDAAINHGNSGGALVDANGNIIGVNVAIASSGSGDSSASEGGSIGVGFAIPIDYAKRIAQDLIANGKATHGMLGVTVQAKPADVKDGNSSFSVGAQVKDVVPNSAGAKSGLKAGDIITGVGDRVISDSSSLTAAIREIPAGGQVTIHYTRNGQPASADATVGASTAS